MILSEQQIKDIITNNPNKELINDATKRSKELRLHIDGDNLSTAIMRVDGFEDLTMNKLRTLYAKSNKDLMARMARPLDKIFSAKGGSLYFNLSGDSEKKARTYYRDIRNGYSVKQWIEHYWKPNFLRDPNGFIFMEIASPQQVALLRQQGKSFVYPTYKSISSVYDYAPKGAQLDYVVFKLTTNEKKSVNLQPIDIAYRVVDDAADYIVQLKDGSPVILTEMTLPNLFLEVPALMNSDIPNPSKPGQMLSLFDDVMELCNEFLLKGSIRITHEFMHAFPKYWEYADDCMTCQENGVATGLLKSETCPDCKGTTKKLMSKVSDVKLLAYPESKEHAVVTPYVGGYISPDKVYFDISTQGAQFLEDLISHTIWSTSSKIKSRGTSIGPDKVATTATEIMDDLKPQVDRLYPISEMAEKRDKFIIDMAIRIQLNQSYQGASVNYGKRYMLEPPDAIWDKFLGAKTEGASPRELRDLLIEYYEAKYSSDPVKLAVQIKLIDVEPWFYLTALEVQTLMPNIEDYTAKLYFSEWLSTLTELQILNTDVAGLKTLLTTYTSGKKAQFQTSVAAVSAA